MSTKKNPFTLKGKVALISGSSRGIGSEIARSIYQAGGHPIICYQSKQSEAKKLAQELGNALCLNLDVADQKGIETSLEGIHKKHGKLDILINNAGILEQKAFEEISELDWEEVMRVNLQGPFLLTKLSLPFLQKQSGSSIINISSMGGQFGGPKAPHYSASKGGLITFTKSCARLFAKDGIRVNAIAPGFIKTEMYDQIIKTTSPKDILSNIPLDRIGTGRDVGQAAVFLASEAASFITGHTLNVNGGQWMD